eukprot:1438375-Amphidinium_carterae.2
MSSDTLTMYRIPELPATVMRSTNFNKRNNAACIAARYMILKKANHEHQHCRTLPLLQNYISRSLCCVVAGMNGPICSPPGTTKRTLINKCNVGSINELPR